MLPPFRLAKMDTDDTPEMPRLGIEATVAADINLALAQNAVPIIRDLAVGHSTRMAPKECCQDGCHDLSFAQSVHAPQPLPDICERFYSRNCRSPFPPNRGDDEGRRVIREGPSDGGVKPAMFS